MKPMQVFWLIVAIGCTFLLSVFFVVRSSNEQRLEQEWPTIVEEDITPEPQKQPEETNTVEDPIIISELEVVTPDETTPDETGPDSEVSLDNNVQNAQLALTTKKVTHYHNEPIGYGMIVPYGTYYSGFGPQEGSIHSVGFSGEQIPESFSDAQVQVLYYGNRAFDELTSGDFYQDSNTNNTYLRILDDHYIRIHTESLDDPILQAVLDSIYVGPSLEDRQIEEEKEEE